jgi:hypothetical protein
MSKMLIDVGSTYFKTSTNDGIKHYFRNFDIPIHTDLKSKCGDDLAKFDKENIHICSSANGGLSTLIIGISESFSLKYATNIAYNSGINIIDTVLYREIKDTVVPSETIDIVIVVGGIDDVANIYDQNLIDYLRQVNYTNIVYVGSKASGNFLEDNIEDIKIMDNIINNKLHMVEDHLKEYLTNLYNQDIMGKSDIKNLYELTANQIFSTPYIVNQSLPYINTILDNVDPFIVVDIGGATTDIHYSKELADDNIVTTNEYDRLVFKKLGVYKSKDSLVFSAKNNEFVYELLNYLNTTENELDTKGDGNIKLLMCLAIFLVLYKVSHHHKAYLNLKLESLNSVVFTGGITKVLDDNEIQDIVSFFYNKILNMSTLPEIVVDRDYAIWTLGIRNHTD